MGIARMRFCFRGMLGRWGEQHGFMSGSIQEVLVVMPMLVIIVLAGMGFAVTAHRTETRTFNRSKDLQEAQRGLDRMVRELRRADQISYVAPSLSFTDPGVTNIITARTRSAKTGQTGNFVYLCSWASGTAEANCSSLNGSWQYDDHFVPQEWTADPVTGKWLAGPRIFNPSASAPTTQSESDSFGVFHFERNGQPADPSVATNLRIRLVVCAQSQTCNAKGMTQPVVLEADVSPRNGFGG
jgi:Tfp pilus assembly protein PilV